MKCGKQRLILRHYQSFNLHLHDELYWLQDGRLPGMEGYGMARTLSVKNELPLVYPMLSTVFESKHPKTAALMIFLNLSHAKYLRSSAEV